MLFSLKRDYFYVPKDINKQVQKHSKGKKVSASVYLFNAYIHLIKAASKERKCVVSHDKVLQIMQLWKEQELRNYNRIRMYVIKALDIVVSRGVVTHFKTSKGSKGQDIYIFYW
jgi:hypothetical protein